MISLCSVAQLFCLYDDGNWKPFPPFSAELAGNGKPFPLYRQKLKTISAVLCRTRGKKKTISALHTETENKSAHKVHLPCGLAVIRVPYNARSSHPCKCSDSEHFMLLLRQLLCIVLFLAFPPLCVVLWILFLCVCGGLLGDVLSSNLHNWTCSVSNIFWIVLGIVCLVTNGISCPLLLSV